MESQVGMEPRLSPQVGHNNGADILQTLYKNV